MSNTNFLKFFEVILAFQRDKYTFFKKLKNWSSCKKTDYHFLGKGGVKAKSDKYHFLILFF